MSGPAGAVRPPRPLRPAGPARSAGLLRPAGPVRSVGARRPGGGAAGGERGSGTVLLLGVVGAGAVLLGLLALLLSAQSCRGRAQAAADLAALAGAAGLRAGEDPCTGAARVVLAHRVRMTGCADEGAGVVGVEAVCSTPAGPARATARAGPATARGALAGPAQAETPPVAPVAPTGAG